MFPRVFDIATLLTMDEYSQPDTDYDSGQPDGHSTGKRKRSGGNRTAQIQRWRARHRLHYNDYMRRYMANARQASEYKPLTLPRRTTSVIFSWIMLLWCSRLSILKHSFRGLDRHRTPTPGRGFYIDPTRI